MTIPGRGTKKILPGRLSSSALTGGWMYMRLSSNPSSRRALWTGMVLLVSDRNATSLRGGPILCWTRGPSYGGSSHEGSQIAVFPGLRKHVKFIVHPQPHPSRTEPRGGFVSSHEDRASQIHHRACAATGRNSSRLSNPGELKRDLCAGRGRRLRRKKDYFPYR